MRATPVNGFSIGRRGFAVLFRLLKLFCAVVVPGDLGIVRKIRRAAAAVLAGGTGIGQGLLGQPRLAGGYITLGAAFDGFLLGAERAFAFVTARPADGFGRNTLVLITTAGFDFRHRLALGPGDDVTTLRQDSRRAGTGDQKQDLGIHDVLPFKTIFAPIPNDIEAQKTCSFHCFSTMEQGRPAWGDG
ncbi:hypothetical protein J3P89_11065 [Pseudomonas sp. Z1-14]|uniref:hypothetical protein n=1 Tax=Pseudomonas sp. Z1-14 TaxID=2817409 RepID=UPI003DAA3DE2